MAENTVNMERYLKNIDCMKKYYSGNHDGEVWDWRDLIQDLAANSIYFQAAPRVCFGLTYEVAPMVEYAGLFQKIKVKRSVGLGGSKGEEIGYWWAQVQQVQGYYVELRWHLYTYAEQSKYRIGHFWRHVTELGLKEMFESTKPLPPEDIPGVFNAELVQRLREFEDDFLTENDVPMMFQGVTDGAVFRTLPGGETGIKMTYEVRDFDHVNVYRKADLKEFCGFRPRLEVKFSNGETQSFLCDPNWEHLHLPGWAESVGIELTQKKNLKSRHSITGATKSVAQDNKDGAAKHNVEVGHLFEMIHPTHLTSIVAGEVTKVLKQGYFFAKIISAVRPQELKDNANSTNEFLFHIDSPYIFACGTCEKGGKPGLLQPPVGNDGKPLKQFDWNRYFLNKKKQPLPILDRQLPSDLQPNFRCGHLLEATDLSNLNFIAPAFVVDVLRPYLVKLRFLGWDHKFDQWRPTTDKHLYPIGWTRLMHYPLSPPGSQTEPNTDDNAQLSPLDCAKELDDDDTQAEDSKVSWSTSGSPLSSVDGTTEDSSSESETEEETATPNLKIAKVLNVRPTPTKASDHVDLDYSEPLSDSKLEDEEEAEGSSKDVSIEGEEVEMAPPAKTKADTTKAATKNTSDEDTTTSSPPQTEGLETKDLNKEKSVAGDPKKEKKELRIVLLTNELTSGTRAAKRPSGVKSGPASKKRR